MDGQTGYCEQRASSEAASQFGVSCHPHFPPHSLLPIAAALLPMRATKDMPVLILVLLSVSLRSVNAFLSSAFQQQHLGFVTKHQRPAAFVNGQAVTLSSLKSSGSASGDGEMATYESEEVLLRMNLGINAGIDPEAAIKATREFARGFPFAAVLPVQPLTYLPSPTGVKVTFLRKKTEEKGSQDGGMDFSIEFTDVAAPDDDDEIGVGTLGGRRIRLLATRISEGQTVSKMFSEKMVITEFVKGISSATDSPSALGVSVESYFHKWME